LIRQAALCWKKCSNELNGTGGKEKELAAPMSSMISNLYQPAPEPSGQKHQNQITFSPPNELYRISAQGVV